MVLDTQRIKFACHGVELPLSVFGVLDASCEISLLLQRDLLEDLEVALNCSIFLQLLIEYLTLRLQCQLNLRAKTLLIIGKLHDACLVGDMLCSEDRGWGVIRT